MEKNIYLECEQHQSSQSLRQFIVRLKDTVCRPVRWFSAYYSAVLGREISMRQTLHLLQCAVGFRVCCVASRHQFCGQSRLLWLAVEGCYGVSQVTLEHG